MIKFVFFDVGGVVILDISDDTGWNKYKKDINLSPAKYEEFDKFWDQIDPELNTSKKVDDIIPVVEKKFDIHFPTGYSIQRDLLNRFKKNKSIWPVINEVKKQCRIGLLTNMYPGMLKDIKERGIMSPNDWDLVVDSSIVNKQKPDRGMYEIAQKMAKVKGDEILFIDNSKRNIQAAKEFGWNVFLYDRRDLEEANKKLLEYFNTL